MATFFNYIRFLDVLDILLVAFLIYKLYYFFRGTVGLKIMLAILMIFIGWRIVKALHMVMLSEILGTFIGAGMILMIVVFQPEIRSFLLMIGNAKFLKRSTTGKHKFLIFKASDESVKPDLDVIVRACQKMSDSKTGALIVLSRTNALENYIKTGTEINAVVSDRLIENIFFKNSPLHDGAMIITKKSIVAAGVILPVSSSDKVPKEYGLRHRAAMGISEETDAISIVVSEQTGEIALCKDRLFTENIAPADLRKALDTAFSE